jgi:hypothetical protein
MQWSLKMRANVQCQWLVAACAVFSLVSGETRAMADDRAKTVEELLHHVIEGRTRWKSGEFDLKVSGTVSGQKSQQAWTIFFDGAKTKCYRTGLTFAGATAKAGDAPAMDVLCGNCYDDGVLVYFNTARIGHSPQFALSLYNTREVESKLLRVFDVHVLGLVPSLFQSLSDENVQQWYGVKDADISVADDQIGGQRYQRVTLQHAPFTRLDIWIVAKGAAVKQVTLRSNLGNDEYIDSVASDYDDSSQFDELVPTRCVYKRTVNGKTEFDEKTEIQVKSLNQPLDKETFELSSIPDLLPGTTVNWTMTNRTAPGEPGTLIWDGTRIASVKDVALQAASSTRNWFIAANVLIVCLVTALLLRRKLRASRRRA